MTLLRIRKVVSIYRQLYRSGSIRDCHVPRCYGYFVNNEGYGRRSGVLLGKPLHVYPEATPVALQELLTTMYHDKPSVSERGQIMLSVHQSLESIHDMGFTHQALCSDSFFFFRDQVNKDANLLDPYISGFGSSLIVDHDETFHPPPDDLRLVFYRHPTLTLRGDRHDGGYDKSEASGFPKSNDLFALGIVLLELALWEPIEAIMDVDLRHARSLENVVVVESRCYLGNQTQLLLRGPQLWKEQVAGKQST
jgi:hypothetical protein